MLLLPLSIQGFAAATLGFVVLKKLSPRFCCLCPIPSKAMEMPGIDRARHFVASPAFLSPLLSLPQRSFVAVFLIYVPLSRTCCPLSPCLCLSLFPSRSASIVSPFALCLFLSRCVFLLGLLH